MLRILNFPWLSAFSSERLDAIQNRLLASTKGPPKPQTQLLSLLDRD